MADDSFNYWFPWYPARFKKKTLHLSIIQRAIYRELIDFYMETRSALPDSDLALARIVGISVEEFTPHSGVIRAFFRVKKIGKNSVLFHPTCDGVLRDQQERSEERRENAKKAGKKSAEKRQQKQGKSNATLNGTPTGVQPNPTTGQDSTVQDKTGKKETTYPDQPSVKNPLTPKRAPEPQRGGGFKQVGFGVGGGGPRFDIRNHLDDSDFREMLILTPGWDRNKLIDRYNDWVADKGIPDKPGPAFRGWLKKQPKNP